MLSFRLLFTENQQQCPIHFVVFKQYQQLSVCLCNCSLEVLGKRNRQIAKMRSASGSLCIIGLMCTTCLGMMHTGLRSVHDGKEAHKKSLNQRPSEKCSLEYYRLIRKHAGASTLSQGFYLMHSFCLSSHNFLISHKETVLFFFLFSAYFSKRASIYCHFHLALKCHP